METNDAKRTGLPIDHCNRRDDILVRNFYRPSNEYKALHIRVLHMHEYLLLFPVRFASIRLCTFEINA